VSETKARLSRRNFLLTVGAGSAATAAAIVTKSTSPGGATNLKDKRATRGYQAESGHVNNYYRTTKV